MPKPRLIVPLPFLLLALLALQPAAPPAHAAKPGARASAAGAPPAERGARDLSDDGPHGDKPTDCDKTAEAAEGSVRDLFGRLVGAYDVSVPGPAGEALRKKRAEEVARDAVDVSAFSEAVLGRAWRDASPELRARWQSSLGALLNNRYVERLRDPRKHTLQIARAAIDCDRASVVASLAHKGKEGGKAYAFRLVRREGVWRAWDVSVDGVSLVATYRHRFSRIYADGGERELDRVLVDTAKRYGVELPPLSPDPPTTGTKGG